MKLDVATPQAVRIEFGRIDWYPENRESDHEFVVIDTWFSVVSHADAVVDQRKGRVVGLGCATNFTCLKVTKGREIPGDACPVDAKGRGRRGRGQSAAMVDVLKVPPEITLLASTPKFPWTPLSRTMKPPPVTKSHGFGGGGALTEPPGSPPVRANTATNTNKMEIVLRIVAPPCDYCACFTNSLTRLHPPADDVRRV